MIRLSFLAVVGISVLFLASASAGEERQFSDLGFNKGTHEFEGLAGWFTSVNDATRKRPRFTFGLATARLGWMLNDTRSGLFFGNEEFMIEGFAGPTLDGPGDVLVGSTLILRHNFATRADATFVPYFQIGAGLAYSDASEADKVQFAIGLPVEFNLQSNLGVRWRVNRSWSLQTEFNYRHLSNAGLSSKNGGVDLVGGSIGFGRLF